jgi:hypothetical protein
MLSGPAEALPLAESPIEVYRIICQFATLLPVGRQIEAIDRKIDRLVYELYALTDDEIKIVEDATHSKWFGSLPLAGRVREGEKPPKLCQQLTRKEFTDLRRQIGTSSSWGGRRTQPWAFTEQGVAMLSSVLRSKRATQVNIEIMRAFVRLREILATHTDLARRLDELEKKYDKQFAAVFDAIRQLMAPPKHDVREIGYHTLINKK